MTTTKKATTSDLAKSILDVVSGLDTCGVVNLGHFKFDRIPCSRKTLYAVARKHAKEWGYEYESSEYVPSGNRAFQRNHKRGQYRNPSLVRLKEAIR